MRRHRTLLASLLAVSLIVSACGGTTEAEEETPETTVVEETPETTVVEETPETTVVEETPETTTAEAGPSGMVTIYTGRHYGIEPVFDAFTAATGIEIRFTTGNDPELRERLTAEGANTPADVVMTADASNIELAAEAGLLASLDSEVLVNTIPEELRDEDNQWFALSQRLRVIIASTERVDNPPTSYAGVGDPEWNGRLCLRPSTHPYTQSLVASLILNEGEERATEIVQSWVDNDPLYINSDTDMYNAVAAGDCDIALANTYYLGRLLTEDPNFPVQIVWPVDEAQGAHVNISAAAVTANAPNPEAAQLLLEWLATDGQSQFTNVNFEYPADPTVEPDPIVAAWGDFTADLAAIRQLGANQPAAVEVLSITGYE
jgi:iron(III) transport system substrate-binding protein